MTPLKTHIAVIIPVYNSLKILPDLITRLSVTLGNISENYEIFLVDDCGSQPTWQVIDAHARRDRRIVGIKLSRNFGQHPAITAGMRAANSEWYVVMDCDLQDRPEDIAILYETAVQEEHDCVLAVRSHEDIGRRKKLGSRIFNYALNHLGDIPVSTDVGNFRIFNDNVAQAYHLYSEQMRLFPALISHLGFDIGRAQVKRPARAEGQSGYSFRKLFRLGFDSMISNTIKPIYFMASFGFLVATIAIIFTVILVSRKIIWGVEVEGWASTIAAIMMLSGIQIFVISFVGIYVGKVFFEVKRRPIFIVKETTRREDHEH